MKLKHFLVIALLLAAIDFTPIGAYAQIDADGDGFPDGDPDTNVPFDGGISILVAAGVAYGLKKKYDDKKQITEKEVP